MAEIVAHVGESGEQQTLRDHLNETGDLAGRFAESVALPHTGKLLGLLHDIGKASHDFQNYLLSATGLLDQDSDDYVDAKGMKGNIDHSTAAAQWCWREPSSDAPQRLDGVCRQILTLCLCSHHSGLIDNLSPDGETCLFDKRMRKPDLQIHLEEALTTLEASYWDKARHLFADKALPELRAFVRRLNKDFSGREQPVACRQCSLRRPRAPAGMPSCVCPHPLWHFRIGLLTRLLLSCLIDADRINSADFVHKENTDLRSRELPDWNPLIQRLEGRLAAFANDDAASSPVNTLREQVAAHCLACAPHPRGLYTLTVPTGGGKTLASLRFALHHAKEHGMARIIHVIPYTSIIDQNAAVARDILEQGEAAETVVLEHHSNIAPEDDPWTRRLLAENWDAPVVYTTMVQFLEALFDGGTRAARRMHRLAGAVLVFDEIQTLPLKCAHLFCNAVNFLVEHCGSSVVLCTATQPLLHALPEAQWGQLPLKPENEIMPDVETLYASLKRVEIMDRTCPEGWSTEDLATFAMEECARAGSCLVVVNTKKMAHLLFGACAQAASEGVFHLSTAMCAAHRLDLLHLIRKRLRYNREHPEAPQPVLCISTQLIEAGVDVDFAAAIRSRAGLDSILQTAGRCNRHGLTVSGTVSIVNPREEKLNHLHDIAVGAQQAARVMEECGRHPVIQGDYGHPEAVRLYFRYAFYHQALSPDGSNRMLYPVDVSRAGRNDTLLHMLSCNKYNPGDMPVDKGPLGRQSFHTAGRCFTVIDAPTQGVVVPYGKGAEIIAELSAAPHPLRTKQLLREAQRYTVNVYSNLLQTLSEFGALHELPDIPGIYYLDAQFYDSALGVCPESCAPLDTLIF